MMNIKISFFNMVQIVKHPRGNSSRYLNKLITLTSGRDTKPIANKSYEMNTYMKYINRFPNFGQVTELPTNRFAAQAAIED